MPGVTIANPAPQRARIAGVSRGEATTPSSPASRASSASRRTWSIRSITTPVSRSAAWFMLVSTVTAITSGGVHVALGGRLVRRVARGLHHRRAAARVHVDHPHAEPGRRRDGRRHGVGDVVELEVEEDAVAALGERPHHRRAFRREQPAADLESADRSAQRVGESQRLVARLDVERDQDLVLHELIFASWAFSRALVSTVPTMSCRREMSCVAM